MKMNHEQLAYVLGFVRAKKLDKCPICGHNKMQLDNDILEVDGFDPNKGMELRIGEIQKLRRPIIQVFCESCGYLMLFSAVVIGLFTPVKIEDIKENEEQKNNQEIKPIIN